MEKLTKENFWNELHSNYPTQMQCFCDWIDAYKNKVQWEKLFNYGFPYYAKQGWHNPKYHDLPIGLQIGIFLEFTFEMGQENFLPGDLVGLENFKERIKQWFAFENKLALEEIGYGN